MILSSEELQVIRYQKTCFVVLGCCTVFPAGACLALSLLTNCTVHLEEDGNLHGRTFQCGYLFVLNDLCCTNKLHQGNKWSTVGSKNSTQAFDVWCAHPQRKGKKLNFNVHSFLHHFKSTHKCYECRNWISNKEKNWSAARLLRLIWQVLFSGIDASSLLKERVAEACLLILFLANCYYNTTIIKLLYYFTNIVLQEMFFFFFPVNEQKLDG